MAGFARPFGPKKDGGPVRVVAIGRLSKPKKTEEATQQTMASSTEVAKQHLRQIYDGPIEIHELTEQASGLIADRPTFVEAQRLIETGEIDIVISEELSRVHRDPAEQWRFVGLATDFQTRVILVADGVDTLDENWEVLLLAAMFRHSVPIPDQRRRTKRTLSFAFHRGGNVQKVKFGFRKLAADEARSGEFGPPGLHIAKVPELTQIIQAMCALLAATRSYAAVLDWLEQNQIAAGPYAKDGRWSTNMIKDLLTDPILVGVRRFRTTLSERWRRSGEKRRRPNPEGPQQDVRPELAHLTQEEFEALQTVIAEIAEDHKRPGDSEHPRKGIRRAKAYFPFRHAICPICQATLYSYDTDQLKCQNARRSRIGRCRECWNHVQVDVSLARKRILEWVVDELKKLPQFLPQFTGELHRQLAGLGEKGGEQLRQARARLQELRREQKCLVTALRQAGEIEAIIEELRKIEVDIARLANDVQALEAMLSLRPTSFSATEVAERLPECVAYLAEHSYEFGDLMRRLLPRFVVVPVQDLLSGLVRPRALLTLHLADTDGTDITSSTEIDLFDPPLHYRMLEQCVRLKAENPSWSLRKIADRLTDAVEPISYMTVKRCLKVDRQLKALGLESPYRVLTAEPERASRWKRKTG